MRWEYKIIDTEHEGNPDSEFELTELGGQSWELVTITKKANGTERWYFKRHVYRQDEINKLPMSVLTEEEAQKRCKEICTHRYCNRNRSSFGPIGPGPWCDDPFDDPRH